MTKLITTIVLLNIFLTLNAQEDRAKDFGILLNNSTIKNYDRVDAALVEIRTNNNSVIKSYSDIKGTPYVFEAFMMGKIIGVNQELMLRYNAFSDEVEIQKTETENGALLKDNLFNTVLMNFGKYKLRLLNYKTSKNESVYGYLVEVFSTNDFLLLRRDKIILENEKVPKNSFEPYYPAKFTKAKSEFYIEKKDKVIIPVPKNKKELVAVFPNQKEEIETFFKNKNYSFKEEQDLIEISKFIATLS